MFQEFWFGAAEVVRVIIDQATLVEAAIRANLQHWDAFGSPMPPHTIRPRDRFGEAWERAVLADTGESFCYHMERHYVDSHRAIDEGACFDFVA